MNRINTCRDFRYCSEGLEVKVVRQLSHFVEVELRIGAFPVHFRSVRNVSGAQRSTQAVNDNKFLFSEKIKLKIKTWLLRSYLSQIV